MHVHALSTLTWGLARGLNKWFKTRNTLYVQRVRRAARAVRRTCRFQAGAEAGAGGLTVVPLRATARTIGSIEPRLPPKELLEEDDRVRKPVREGESALDAVVGSQTRSE